MEIDLLSDILGENTSPFYPQLLQGLPTNKLNATDPELASSSVLGPPKSSTQRAPRPGSNPNQTGVVITKIEDILDTITDCILAGKKELVIELKSRSSQKKKDFDHDVDMYRKLRTSIRKIRYPSKCPTEAWRFGMSRTLNPYRVTGTDNPQLHYVVSSSYHTKLWLLELSLPKGCHPTQISSGHFDPTYPASMLHIFQYKGSCMLTCMLHRDIFYREPELFKKQSVVDRYVDDIAYTFDVNRSALHVVNEPPLHEFRRRDLTSLHRLPLQRAW